MSAGSSHVQTIEDSPISPEDILLCQQAIALADQTLELSSTGPLCPATKEKATDLKESAHEGLFPDSRTNERYTTDDYRCDDLIAELCQIFREHYVLKYMDCHVDDLPVALHKLEYGQERADFLQILKENTPSGRRQRDFNRYTDKLLRGEYNAMAGHLRRDRNLLTTTLHRAEDASLRSILSDAVNKKEKSLFLVNKYIFNGYDDPFWRVYPAKEAVEMSVFQDYWEQRPRRRTDGEDDPFGIPDLGLGPFSW
ncbi:hypothetical protein K4K60_008336 [Colletotrichum sp. SAR11_57]|nr:hypothetical protein K4K60_008336 [Colletotrichum sp. SAR11_57]